AGARPVRPVGEPLARRRLPGVDHPRRGLRHARSGDARRRRHHAGGVDDLQRSHRRAGHARRRPRRACSRSLPYRQGRQGVPRREDSGVAVQITVDAWDPSFADNAESPSRSDSATVNAEVETPTGEWEPVDAPPTGPTRLLVVDGVRRVDARVELSDESGRWPGVCVSWAAGAVACDLDGGASAVTESSVERGLFAPLDPGVDFGGYPFRKVDAADSAELIAASQAAMATLEAKVAAAVAADAELSV